MIVSLVAAYFGVNQISIFNHITSIKFNVWDTYLSIFGYGLFIIPMMIFPIVLTFWVGDLFLKDRLNDFDVLVSVRATTRTMYWASKIISIFVALLMWSYILWTFALIIGLIRGVPFGWQLSQFGLTRDAISFGKGALPPYVSFTQPVAVVPYELLICFYFACTYFAIVLFAIAITLRAKNSYLPLGIVTFLAILQVAFKEGLTNTRRDLTWVGTLFESSHRNEIQYGHVGGSTPWWVSIVLVGAFLMLGLILAYFTDPCRTLFKKRRHTVK